jgi:hypothetical protein
MMPRTSLPMTIPTMIKKIREGTPSLVENLVVNTPTMNKKARRRMNESVLITCSANKNSPFIN